MAVKRIYAVIIVVAVLACLCSCGRQDNKKATSVATVNGESITADELNYFKGKLKAQVLNDYLQEYSAVYSPDFWSRKFNGKTPEQALKEQALEKCVMAKIQLVLMRENGIYEDITYQGLYKKAITFNEANSDKSGVVGLKSIKMSQFYSYYLDNGVMELRNMLAENKIKPTEDEINERAKLLMASSQDFGDNDLKSVAASKLIAEKYDKYIADLRNSADVKIIDAAAK